MKIRALENIIEGKQREKRRNRSGMKERSETGASKPGKKEQREMKRRRRETAPLRKWCGLERCSESFRERNGGQKNGKGKREHGC